MQETIITMPELIEKEIIEILGVEDADEWITRAQFLHTRYMQPEKNTTDAYINDYIDVLAYLALRSPATYAQILGALSAVKELVPSWQPKSMLDIGSGPGTGVWAAESLFPSLTEGTCIDRSSDFLSLGKKIMSAVNLPVSVSWQAQNILDGLVTKQVRYDIVLISNVLNELTVGQREKLLGQAFNHCSGIMLIIEPGTPVGSSIIQAVAKNFSHHALIAPYIGNSIDTNKDYWLHFSQRFKRPEFQRRIRQHMRDSSLMASDWEEAKYSYVAISKITPEITPWGRCVGQVQIQKGFLEIPILTKDTLSRIKVMKRHKKQYDFAKKLRWGELVMNSEDLLIGI